MKFEICVASGLEAVAKRELEKLGIFDSKAIDGKIEVEGDYELLATLSVWLRSADRILIKLAEFDCTDFDTLFNETKKIEWEKWIGEDACVLMNGNCFKSRLMAIKVSGGVIKKAIMSRLEKVYLKRLRETGREITVYFSIVNNKCEICLDASGDGLHKRGYRKITYTAPLKETLAAGIVLLSIFKGDKPMADLFCGSGTIAIEAALIARNIAPNLKRHFAFENFVNYQKGILENVKNFAKTQEIDILPNIFASDINPEAIELAKQNAKNAGVEKYIHFEVMDMKNFVPKDDYGVIISNPPYGERLGTKNEVSKLNTDFFKMLKKYPTWSAYYLTDEKNLENLIGRKADKKRKLYNARIECNLYSFLGTKPPKKVALAEEK